MTLFRSFFLDFSWLSIQGLSGAFRGFVPLPEGRANLPPREGKAQKEANFHPQTAKPTFTAKGQLPFQEGMGTTDSKKEGQEGPTTTEEKKKQQPRERRANSPSREGRANTKGPTHSEKAGTTFTSRAKSKKGQAATQIRRGEPHPQQRRTNSRGPTPRRKRPPPP